MYLHFIFDLCEALFINTMRILLKNGKIYDGTGSEAFAGDILVEDERIAGGAPQAQEQAAPSHRVQQHDTEDAGLRMERYRHSLPRATRKSMI